MWGTLDLAAPWRRMRAGIDAREREGRTDALTGLPNRLVLMELLDEAVTPVARPSTLVLFDLDGFKRFADRFGHRTGQALLARMASRLSAAVAGRGTVFRLGGDEFCVLLGLDEVAARGAIHDCLASLTETGPDYDIRPTHGVAALPGGLATASAALSASDRRMDQAKDLRLTARPTSFKVSFRAAEDDDLITAPAPPSPATSRPAS
jgi:diguanylate cyclase (GGDEF)-like protein